MQFILSQFKEPCFRSGGAGGFSVVLITLPVGLGVTDPFPVVTQQLGCHLHGLVWQLLGGGRANTLCSRRSKKHLSVVFALPFPVFVNSRCAQEAQKVAWKGRSVTQCVTIGL